MNGLFTRQQLHQLAHDKNAWLEHEYARLYGTGADKLRRAAQPNAESLGTPLHDERIKQIRRERRYDRAFRFGGILVLLGMFLMIGVSAKAKRDAVDSQITYREKAQRLVAGKMSCELDQHEGCLVCLHKDRLGQPVVTNHC